jgi:hypothetical protein
MMDQVRLTKPLTAAQARQKSLAVWAALVAQQVLPSSTLLSAVLV